MVACPCDNEVVGNGWWYCAQANQCPTYRPQGVKMSELIRMKIREELTK